MIFGDNVDIKERKRLTLSDFRGIDTANPIYRVDSKRATAMRNFVNINGNNHKRPGWRQIARFKDSLGNDLPINGFFRFTLSLEEYRIVYAGTHFFIYNNTTGTYVDLLELMSEQTCANRVDATRLKDQPVQMFVYDDKAYIVGCGDYLVFAVYNNRPELRRVFDDEDTYVPITTTNISSNETDTDENGEAIVYDVRRSDRDVNVLTRFRINELIGSAYASTESERTYNLDTENIDAIDCSITVRDYDALTGETTAHTLTVGDVDTNRPGTGTETVVRNLAVGDNVGGKTLSFNTEIETIGLLRKSTLEYSLIETDTLRIFVRATDNKWNEVKVYSKVGDTEVLRATATRRNVLYRYTITWEENTSITLGAGDNIVRKTARADAGGFDITADLPKLEDRKLIETVGATTTVWGYMNFRLGKLTLVKAAHSIAGEPNITVRFSKLIEEDTEKILSCRFGTYFGTSGNTNTLFLSGSNQAKHFDFWSSPEDFTYFPSGNCCAVGTANSQIMGYLRLGDDSLAIIKSENKYEPTLYIRTGTATSVDAETSVVTDGYYVTSGKYITQGAVSDSAMGMLAGDALFLSRLGVYGLSINADSIAVEQRVSRERSRFINALLEKHNSLATATAIVYDNRYYLAVDGAVYVADARYKFTAKGDMPDTYNYEWWVWDNCPVRRFYEIDNQLCFGTADGRLCVFDKEYTDRMYEQFSTVSFDAENNRIYIDYSVDIATDDTAYLQGTSAYRLLFDSEDMTVNTTDNTICVSENDITKVHVGQSVYADTVSGTGLSLNTMYVVKMVDMGTCEFAIGTVSQGEDEYATLSSGGFRLLIDITGEIVKVDVDTDADSLRYVTCRNIYSDEVYVITPYNGTATTASFFKYIKSNVVAEWYTPIMDMGTNDNIKQLLSLTIATEQITNGNIKFGWETKSVNGLVNIDAKGLDVFDFSNLNFERFAFDTGFSTSFTKKVKAGFNFIVFRFISDNEYDASIYSFTVMYKVNRKNKGVW